MSWWYWVFPRKSHYLNVPDGTLRFAEKLSSIAVANGKEELKKAQRDIGVRLAECKGTARVILQKWNKLGDLAGQARAARGLPQPSNAPFVSPIPAEEYENLRGRVRGNRWILLALTLGEGFMNYLALLVIIPGDEPLLQVARGVIGLIVTIAAFKSLHYALERWSPDRLTAHMPSDRTLPTACALLTLFALAGLAYARALDFEGGGEGGVGFIGAGFIAIALALPIIGGYADLELGRIQPLYDVLRKWRAALKDLRKQEARVQALLTQVDHRLQGVKLDLREDTARIWGGLMDFRVLKRRLDAKRGQSVEDLSGTLAANYQSFSDACIALLDPALREYVAIIDAEKEEIRALVRRTIEDRAGGGSTETTRAAEEANEAEVQATR